MKYMMLIVALASLVVACAAAEKKTGPEPVPVEEWCEAVGKATCRNTGDKCFGAMAGFEEGCMDSFVPRCTGGRSGALSKRSYDDLSACVDYVDSRSCEQLGADTGEAMTGTGSFAQLCKVDAPQGS
jgi:hypothetical protein